MTYISTDPIADMLTRIRNAIAVNKREIEMPHSNMKESVAQVLKKQQLIDEVSVGKDEQSRKPNTNSKITEIARISKPGRREYSRADKIPTIKSGRGLVIVSTSVGMMTGAEAKKRGIGGELICKVY
jgi:small subunit ribosomal protein S8